MGNRAMVVVVAAGALALSACASKKEAAPAGTVSQTSSVVDIPSGKKAESTTTVTATVESVDLSKRLVTLKGPDGQLVTVHADERVKNLPQVRKGDQVAVTYYESIAYELLKPGEGKPGVASSGDVVTAAPGQKPAAAGAQVTTVTATISAIDKQTQHVTLRGPDGNTVAVKVKDPTRLDKVKVGDLVQITYTEAVAVSVEPAAKK